MSAMEFPIGNLPRKGTEIHLIRWLRTDDSWTNETVLVTFVEATEDDWLVSTRGGGRRLPREEWAIFSV